MQYGGEPICLGQFDLAEPEMMFIQYMPIVMPPADRWWDIEARIPKNVAFVAPLIHAIEDDIIAAAPSFVYLTVKSLYVTAETMARPGWHTDGFGTDDLNFIWSDTCPTEFCIQPFDLSDDCDTSLRQMEEQARPENIRTYGEKMLLKLDSTVVHRVPANAPAGFRTFVKISISKDRYNLKGNAHNYKFDYDWPMFPRGDSRNHPAQGQMP